MTLPRITGRIRESGLVHSSSLLNACSCTLLTPPPSPGGSHFRKLLDSPPLIGRKKVIDLFDGK